MSATLSDDFETMVLLRDWIVKQRKSLEEHPLGTITRTMEVGYCFTKGKEKVSGTCALTFLAYTMKRVIHILGTANLLKVFAL